MCILACVFRPDGGVVGVFADLGDGVGFRQECKLLFQGAAGVIHVTGLVLALTFSVCVAFDLLFLAHAMFRSWQTPLPGFERIGGKSFAIGLIESCGYG